MAGSHTGYLLMADISGYTAYLNQSELEHARDILGSLLEVLVNGTRPPLVVSKLEGDAVLSYTPGSELLNGQTLVEIIENIYLAFRRAIDLMVLNNTCQCNACANVSALDLKLFLHYGTFAIQKVGEREELFGNDVVLTHRLLKNTIVGDTGFAAYAAYTDAALSQLGEALRSAMIRVDQIYDDVGTVTVWVQDMHPVWEAGREKSIVELTPEDTHAELTVEFDLPPEVVWDYLSDVRFRMTLTGSDRQEIVDRRNGRVAEGSTFQCYHGDRVISQLILEWRPFQRIVTRDHLPQFGGGLDVLSVYELEADGAGTIVTARFGGLSGPRLTRAVVRLGLRFSKKEFLRSGAAFREAIEADHAERVAG